MVRNTIKIIPFILLGVLIYTTGTFHRAEITQAAGNTYYVSNSGNNNNSGTINSPWQTISYAVSRLTAGDTLYIRGGTYSDASNIIDSKTYTVPSGTSWTNTVTIAGYPGETVTIQPPWGRRGISLDIGAPHYLVFQDFIVDSINNTSPDGGGVYLADGANHNRFLRLEIKNNWADGIGFSGHNGDSPYNEVIDSNIHDNGLDMSKSNPGYGGYISTTHNLFEGNDVYNNHGYGIQFNGILDLNSFNVIRKNRIHNNFVNPCPAPPCIGGLAGGGIAVMSGNSNGDPSLYADSNEIYDNLVYNNGVGGPPGSGATGILVYSRTRNTKVYNNTVFGNLSEGIMLQYYQAGTIIRNNIIYGNGVNGIIDYSSGQAVALTSDGGSPTVIVSNNLTNNPSFVNAGSIDFHLQSSSSAINTGYSLGAPYNIDFSGNSRPSGSAYDIGAYEYGGSATPPPPPPPSPTPTPTPPPSIPSIPTGLNATSNGNSITLHWSANPTSENVDTYQAYEADNNLNLSIPSTQTLYTTTIDHNGSPLVSGNLYSFRVSAHNSSGYGGWTNPINSSLGATATPGDLNLDHIVNSLDWSIMNSKWFTTDATSDLNHDGLVNAIDFSILNANWFKTW